MKPRIDEKRGRKPLSKTHDEDVRFLKASPEYANVKNTTNKINSLRAKFLKALERNNVEIEDAAQKSLAELDRAIKTNGIKLSKRSVNWKVHEKDVVAGINSLFESDFFKLLSADGQQKEVDKKAYFARQVGGGLKSDVEVVHKRKATDMSSFFVECKLNLEAAEYFKFGLQVDGAGDLKYDHSRFLEGAVKDDKEQLKAIDELFTKKIDLNKFLKHVVSRPDVKKYWQTLISNLNYLKRDLDRSDEFNQFSKAKKLVRKLPDDFAVFAEIFDDYCEWYVELYDKLIDRMLELITDDTINYIGPNKENYKINFKKFGKNDRNTVLQTVDVLLSAVKTVDDSQGKPCIKPDDRAEFDEIAMQVKNIEIKLNTLLKHLGIPLGSFNSLSQLNGINKAMYFFKLFVSTTGRKKGGKQDLIKFYYDEFGNMGLIPEVEEDGDVLPQMITDYYVHKDQCAYIQIDKTLLQFDEDFNPLAFPDIPLFKDAVHKFIIRILINDALTWISLHIRAAEIDKKAFAGKKNEVSLRPKDSNFIGKVLDDGVTVKLV